MARPRQSITQVERRFVSRSTATDPAKFVIVVTAVIAALHFGKVMLVPFAFAIILAFVLSPVIRFMRQLYIPRAVAVIFCITASALFVVMTTVYIAMQLQQLTNDLPLYERTLTTKAQSLKSLATESRFVARLTKSLNRLQSEVAQEEKTSQTGTQSVAEGTGVGAGGADEPKNPPLEVVVRQPEGTLLTTLQSAGYYLLPPVAMIGVIFLFLAFILFQREDVRDRAIRLFGSSDLERTTTALNDAAARLSRFLLTQTILNFLYGCIITLALWTIGIPAAPLWGSLAFLMRYVPFVGSVFAALPPLILAAAIDPGWSMLWWTLALFAIGEPMMGNFVEPLVQGQSTGMSPLAIVLSAAFWTLLWGPVGLLLAVPLTLCLVVLGRHIDNLEFLEIALGDRPPLSRVESFYQRLLAGDAYEVADQAERQLEEVSLLEYYDLTVRPGLAVAQRDAGAGFLDEHRQTKIRATINLLVENLEDYDDVTPEASSHRKLIAGGDDRNTPDAGNDNGDTGSPPEDLPVFTIEEHSSRWQHQDAVICIGVSNDIDAAACAGLVHLLHAHRIDAVSLLDDDSLTTALRRLAGGNVQHVSIISLAMQPETARLKFLLRRVRRIMTGIPISVGLLGKDSHGGNSGDTLSFADAVCVATTYRELLKDILDRACCPDRDGASTEQIGTQQKQETQSATN